MCLCGTAFDSQAVLKCVAPVVQVFEVERLASGGARQPLNAQHRRALFNMEEPGEQLIRGRGLDLQLRFAEGDGVVVLDDREDVARGEIFLREALAALAAYISDVERPPRQDGLAFAELC
jgi:hypothetical protein